MLSYKQYLLENQEDFIAVNGIKRSRMNSLGTPIHPTEEGIINFWKWFGDSKVVDNKGRPLVCTHTTNIDFDEFDLNKTNYSSVWGKGIYVSLNKIWKTGNGISKQLYVLSKNPFYLNKEIDKKDLEILSDLLGRKLDAVPLLSLEKRYGSVADGLKIAGYDGIFHDGPGSTGDHLMVFSPNQIKSATGNNGNFNPNSSNLTEAEYQGKAVTLNKPKPSDNPKKKYMVYTKNEKGNVVKVYFGDPNLEIKRDNPKRRKTFRSRHSCDDDKPNKWEPRYWACKFWDKENVSDLI